MSCGHSGQSSVPSSCTATQEAKGIEINQFDLKDAVVSEVFCKNRFSSTAPSFGVHPGFASDITGWDLDKAKRGASCKTSRRRSNCLKRKSVCIR